ncbi:MAG: tetratricopeptide repeat protein [Leptospirales bacterium]|nr:tetratricopeptide repeat protein [Leptospirales bacterium]
MARVLPFPSAKRLGFQRIRASYTLRQISTQFGIPEKYIRRWMEDGIIEARPGSDPNELAFDIRALAKFRSVRDLKATGVNLKQIDAELRGQLNLFGEKPGITVNFAPRTSAFEQALMLFDRGDEKAADLFRTALEQEEHAADCHCNLGIIAFEKGDLSQAMDEFAHALASDPRHFESHFDLANLYFETGDLKLARLHYEAALRIEPEFADTYFNLGLLLAELGELTQAANALRKYTELAEDKELARDLIERIEAAVGQ